MRFFVVLAGIASAFLFSSSAHAALTLTAGDNATTTPNVATSITGFQIVGPSASTTPVKLRATNGTLGLSSISGVTMSGNNSGTVNLSGTVEKLNQALATLTYSRGSTGTDTLEVSLVEPTEVFFETNGHLYQFISGSFTWSSAKTAAEGREAYGSTGYLATITSEAENNFVYNRISGDGWLGTTDTDTEKTWKWMTGPEAGTAYFQENGSGGGGSAISSQFHKWASGEPNDYGSGEDCGYMYASQSGQWNDFPCSAQQGYVVEYGADGDLPTVVAQNISIVTADVPALTSLFPANGASSATTTANLVLRFSKSVSAGTGNISIYQASNDSLIESIDVTGGLVSGGGTNTILVNPSTTLAEGVQYYLTVPSTAFKDGSNNFFSGFIDESTWVFTTLDETAPSITNLSVSVATTTANISWDTNESASTRLWYSADLSYASSTAETDTSPRVTDHDVALSELVACTLYNYRAVSRDAAGNSATSSASSFTTLGCSGGVVPSSATTTSVSVNSSATTTHAESGRTLSVGTPEDFTATSSSVTIQIKGLSAQPVLSVTGIPNALSSVASVVFDVTALINNTTVLDSFDVPVTVSYAYTDADIAGLNEDTLQMFHYKDGAWSGLDACVVDAQANTITCTAPHFSIFAIFGSPTSGASSSAGGTSGNVRAQVKSLESRGQVAKAEDIKEKFPEVFPVVTTQGTVALRDLELGMTGEDVRLLQKLLNEAGYSVTNEGPGSLGNETAYFGALTRSAVSRYQSLNGITPSIGYFGPVTQAHMKAWEVSGVWW